MRSLYIHVPFCFHKCHYCDFYSIVDTRDRQGPFVRRLCRELDALAPWAGALDTVFVGGGTPSLLAVDLWEAVLGHLHRRYDLGGVREFTVECNPETVTPQLMDVLARGGVTRVSIGAQSFHAGHLKTLERWHDPANVARAVALARSAGIGRQSVDLIFGIPGQTVEQWREDLDAALALGTEHVSCYNLTYEPGTAMTARLKRGEFTPADEDAEVEMFRLTPGALSAGGLRRYEVSNFARPGCESLHNMAYWRQEQWLAAGPSASSHVGGRRWKNTPRLDDYLEQDAQGFSRARDYEGPDARRALVERMMTGLRLAEGLDADEMRARAGGLSATAPDRLDAVAARQREAGRLALDGRRWMLTEEGFLLSQGIIVEFMAALD